MWNCWWKNSDRPNTRNTDCVQIDTCRIFVLLLSDFTNFIKNAHLERLAEADQYELIKDIKEFYVDYHALDKNHFSLGLDRIIGEQLQGWDRKQLQVCTEKLAAVLLSLKRRPQIRYEGGSMMATKLAIELKDRVKGSLDSFDFSDSVTVMILDRRSDLVTPLILPWTYQALINDLFGLEQGFVDLSKSPIVTKPAAQSKSSTTFNLVPSQDTFFQENLHNNFGQVTQELAKLVDQYKEKTDASKQLQSLAGIKKFLEDYPQMMKLSGVVGKHMEIASCVSRMTDSEGLLEVSEAEQALVTDNDPSAILQLFSRPDLSDFIRLKLALLLCLKQNGIDSRLNMTQEQRSLIDFILQSYASPPNPSSWSTMSSTLTRTDQNLYTQYVPPLVGLVDALLRGRLRSDHFPILDLAHHPHQDTTLAAASTKNLIVFMVGGSTYLEACHLARLNDIHPASKILLGGTRVINGAQLISEASSQFLRSSSQPSK